MNKKLIHGKIFFNNYYKGTGHIYCGESYLTIKTDGFKKIISYKDIYELKRVEDINYVNIRGDLNE